MEGTTWSGNWVGDTSLQSGSAGTCSKNCSMFVDCSTDCVVTSSECGSDPARSGLWQ